MLQWRLRVSKRPFQEQNGTPLLKENPMKTHLNEATPTFPWNKGRLIGQKAQLKLKEIWAIRI